MACWRASHEGGWDNPIKKCDPQPGAQGTCVIMRFPDPRFCDGFRYEERYDPTDEETEGYDSRTWIAEIGDFLFETVFGVFNSAIDKLTGGIITDWLGEGITLESLLNQAVTNGQAQLIELIDGAGEQITKLVTDSLNKTSEAMGEFYGIAVAQQSIADAVLNETQYLLDEGEWRAEERWRLEQERLAAEAAKAAESIRWAEAIESGVLSSFTDATYEGLKADGVTMFDRADQLLGFTFNQLEVNKDIMYSLAMLHGQTVARSFSEVADAQLDSVNEIMLESIIKPLAQGEAQYQAIKQASIVTPDEFRGSQLELQWMQQQLQKEMLASGISPAEWLEREVGLL